MRGTQNRFSDGSDGPRRRERPDRPDRPAGGGFTINTRLLITIFVAVALLVIVVSSLLPDPSEPDPVAVPTDTTEPTQPRRSPEPTEQPDTDDPTTAPPEEGSDDHDDEEPAPEEAASAATKFVDAWLLQGTETERRDAMKPYATAGLVRSVAGIDLNRLPEGERTGKPQEISSGSYQASFRITLTSDEKVDVVVVFGDDDKWRASEINPAESG